MAATRREGQRELTGPGSKALTALVLMAIPGAAALGALLDGTPSWIVAFGAASIASMVALASIARWGTPQQADHAGGGQETGASGAPVRSSASEEVLRRATEVRCAERTAILENLSDAVVLVDAHGETRFANLAARRMLGEQAGRDQGALPVLEQPFGFTRHLQKVGKMALTKPQGFVRCR